MISLLYSQMLQILVSDASVNKCKNPLCYFKENL